MFHLIGQAIFGLIVGILAKFIMPGKDPGGCIVTPLIGLVGAMLGTFIGQQLRGSQDYMAGWLMSIFGAIVLLALYRMLFGKK
ncbi:MAG: GlsB/YeaQ/YmgE family stress response membrane protein [Vicinamibacteria bacterium]